MTQPQEHPNRIPLSRQAVADTHNFRTRVTPQGDLIDIIKDLQRRVARLEAQVGTH